MLLTKLKSKLRPHKEILKRKFSFIISSVRLKQIDDNVIRNSTDEIRMFVKGRNEALRLPYFLNYYFSKGVDRVFLIDNGSTDETVNIALSHPNVHVFRTLENFKNYCNWMEILLERYGKGHWCVTADVDEILHYPFSGDISLKEFCHFLDGRDEQALQCYLLDMYSEKPIKENAYKAGTNPLEVCSFFDPQFEEAEKTWLNKKNQKPYTCTNFTGNLRKRAFGAQVSLSKIALFRYGDNVFADQGMHAVDGVKFSSMRGVVFHFKYLEDFNHKVVKEAKRGVYAGGAQAYKQYAKKVVDDPDMMLLSDGSQKYKNDDQLIELGLIKVDADLVDYVKKIKSS